MSGGTIHIRLLDTGEEYDMPEAEAFPAMQSLEQLGQKFEANDKPTAAKGQAAQVYSEPDPSIPPQPNPDRGVLDTLSAFIHGDPSAPQTEFSPAEKSSLDEHWKNIQGDKQTAYLTDLASDPLAALGELARTGSRYITGGIGATGGVVAPGLAGAAQSYIDDRQHSPWSAAIGGGLAAAPGLVAAGGKLLNKLSAGPRSASYGGTPEILDKYNQNTGEKLTPEDIAKITDDLGTNNTFWPQSSKTKLDRLDAAASAAGADMGQTVKNADAMGVGQYRDWGGEIARDLDQNAQNVWHGGNPDRGAIVNKFRDAAAAADDHSMTSLEALRRYKTAREGGVYSRLLGGTPESASSMANMAAADSARGHLDASMLQSGPENYAQFKQSAADFGDATLLQEMLRAKRLNAPSSGSMVGDVAASAVGGTIGTAAAGALGTAPGMALGYAARKIGQNYGPDFAANMMQLPNKSGLTGAADAASKVAAPVASSATEQLRQYTDDSRGYLQPDAIKTILERNPQVLGQYEQPLREAAQNGTLNAVLYKLQVKDPEFQQRILPQLQGLTINPG